MQHTGEGELYALWRTTLCKRVITVTKRNVNAAITISLWNGRINGKGEGWGGGADLMFPRTCGKANTYWIYAKEPILGLGSWRIREREGG